VRSDFTLLDVFDWWKSPALPPQFAFASAFIFDSGLDRMDKDEWLWWVRQNEWKDAVLLEHVDARKRDALVFEATDPVTNLRHRIAWIGTWEEGALKRLISAGAAIGSV
jgi:hypothetical protein